MAGYRQHISYSSFESILSNVRKKILDWTLSLEKQNILGEGLYFTEKEKESTNKLTNINIYGDKNEIMSESKVNSLLTKLKKLFISLAKDFSKDFIIQGIFYKLNLF